VLIAKAIHLPVSFSGSLKGFSFLNCLLLGGTSEPPAWRFLCLPLGIRSLSFLVPRPRRI
jgi:hypothetical protein